jgi:uncharacterized protein (TIGR04551 family)
MTRFLPLALALPLLLGSAFAQSPAPAPSAPAATAPAPAVPASAASTLGGTLGQSEIDQRIQEAVQKEVAKVKEQLRDEVRAEIQGAQSASEFLGAQEEKKKLHFLELNGYLRVRWDLFNSLNGDLPADPMGWYLWNGNTDISATPQNGTQTGANMRLRLDPTFNVSEQVRIRAQIDLLDNVVLGSTPTGRNFNQFEFFSGSQVSPVAGATWFGSAVAVKRAWGEVQTPVGLLSFGRMPASWGSGIYYNSGDGIDQDFGDNVDRIQFSIPLGQFLGGLALTPYYEWSGSGITYAGTFNTVGIGQPVNWTNDDDAGAIGLMVARQDTPDQQRRKLEKGASSLNYGLLFNYKSQNFGLPGLSLQSAAGVMPPGSGSPVQLVRRDASAFTFDLFLRWVSKKFELEAEAVGIFGSIGNINWDPAAAAVSASIQQAAGVVRGKVKLGDAGRFALGGEFGVASGDAAPGFGNFPGRCNLSLPVGDAKRCNQMALPGAIDGQQYSAAAGVDPNPSISNYRFNPAYQVDLILWRRLLGTVTDAWYVKPTFRWDVLDGLNVGAQIVYSQAIFATSTPSQVSTPLGVEIDVGVKYQSDDGFVFFLDYGLLKLLSGFDMTTTVNNVTATVNPGGVAQNVHVGLGIVF